MALLHIYGWKLGAIDWISKEDSERRLLRTLLTEIENIQLTLVSIKHTDDEALTPNHCFIWLIQWKHTIWTF